VIEEWLTELTRAKTIAALREPAEAGPVRPPPELVEFVATLNWHL